MYNIRSPDKPANLTTQTRCIHPSKSLDTLVTSFIECYFSAKCLVNEDRIPQY